MRVLMLTTDLALGGVERTIINRAECLREAGVECLVAGLFAERTAPGRAGELLREGGFPVHCAGIERWTDAWRLLALRRLVCESRPDVLHAHLFHGHAAAALLRLSGVGVPTVWSYHAVAPARWPVRRAFYRLLAPLADAHVYVSEAVCDYQLRAGGRPPGGRVIHNGADLGPLLALEPRTGRVFGAVGRMVPLHKGFDVLIRAFARLCREDDEARLRIAGDGPERQSLEELARREGVAGRVHFAGFVTDVAAFLADVNVFVNPSRWEAFGNTLVEGMAAGLPCIASRVGGLVEIGQEFVCWVRPGDASDLYRAMREAAGARPAPERIAAQRAHLAARFSRERMTRDYLELYRSLLRRPFA
jgi:glycosyltransferase involved in cell wall biosynthesis